MNQDGNEHLSKLTDSFPRRKFSALLWRQKKSQEIKKRLKRKKK
jgi:hypothetical protein